MAKTRRRTRKAREKDNEAHQAQLAQHEDRWRRDLEQRGPHPGDPNAPTMERIAREIEAGGERPAIHFERTERGHICSWAWRFEPDLEKLQSRGILDAGRVQAAWQFLEQMRVVETSGNPKIANLAVPVVDGAGAPLRPQDRYVIACRKVDAAIASVPPKRQCWLMWLLGWTDEREIAAVVERYYPRYRGRPGRMLKMLGHDYIAETLEYLAEFYEVPLSQYQRTVTPNLGVVAQEILAIEKKFDYA